MLGLQSFYAILALGLASLSEAGVPRQLQNLEERQTCTNTPTTRQCWSGGLSTSTDTQTTWPNTGKTVTLNWVISSKTLAPDGFSRPMMVVNGQYPGPAIRANWGDKISVTVTNSLTTNGTGIHWHGLRQLNTNQQDGTPGLTECPIAPGQSRTYTFQATEYGTSWYHSHYSVQYGDGVSGPIIINGPTTSNWDIDTGALPLTDWFHTPIFTLNARELHSTGPLTADNALVNGSMTSSSGGAYSVINVTPNKLHLLRIINTGINQYFHVSADGHPFTVVAADFTPITPYTTNSLVLTVGQRYDVIFNASQAVGNYWLRVGTGGGTCDGPNSNAANIRAIIRYTGAPVANPTSTGSNPSGCGEETAPAPVVTKTVPAGTAKQFAVSFSPTTSTGQIFVQWLINGSAIKVDWSHPTLQQSLAGTTSFPTSENLYAIGPANVWTYWVIQNVIAGPPLPHPIHLHGHRFFLLGSGTGTFNPATTLKYNNPIFRDTVTLPAGGWIVVAFQADNPGAWLFHCHVAFHISEGFGVQFLERAGDIRSSIGSTSALDSGCTTWATTGISPPAGDSGL
ncbi:laccase [Microthyrium microscopicum]|uniref:Laccase n=1 Tax=Microthyrium microscopicum TaxID=703497 RepID=A0A6A6UJS2_9PEZI|nr:laccase [Microthyrium microscopicum]